ncbi:hypothetical protein BDR04DRAFT_1114140 [Suillus decipiens]|nr:hypothetical protein BDR04DRAFT_1114140 [Suillus decipiens]
MVRNTTRKNKQKKGMRDAVKKNKLQPVRKSRGREVEAVVYRFYVLSMLPKKNVTKKCCAGGAAEIFEGPLGSPIVSPASQALQVVSPEPELPVEMHSLCNVRAPAPYFGFYCSNLPAQGGQPVLPDFLWLNGKFETVSCMLLASAPITLIHFVIGACDKVITPVPLLDQYLQHFYPHGGYIFLEVMFNVVTHKKINAYTHKQHVHVAELTQHLGRASHVFAFFSNHSEQDSGWLFASKVLSTIFCPYTSIFQSTHLVFLMCGTTVTHKGPFTELKDAVLDLNVASAIIFTAQRFQPLVSTNFLLAMAKLVVVKQLDLLKTFPDLLCLSGCLGQHSKVILMTKDDVAGSSRLSVTTFVRAHTQIQPWGIRVPPQCPLHGSTNSWSQKVPVMVSDQSHNSNSRNQATVTRQCKPPHKFQIEKPPGFIINAARSKHSFNIFLLRQKNVKAMLNTVERPQSFHQNSLKTSHDHVFEKFQFAANSFEGILALHQDKFVTALLPMCQNIVRTIWDQIVARNKSIEDPVVLPKALKKAIRQYYLQFLTDGDDIRTEEEILGDEEDDKAFGVSPEEREAAACPKDAGFYKKEVTSFGVTQKLFKQEIDDYDKKEQLKLGVKNSIKFHMGHARDWFKNMTPAQQKEVEDAKDKWNREGAPAESQAMYQKRNLKKVLKEFTEQVCHTMGCQIVMLVSHKENSNQTLSVVVNKEWTSEGFEKFAEWAKLKFYPNDASEDSDEEDNNMKAILPELVLDKKGYPKLPCCAGINAKGQQELVCWIFHASYISRAEVFMKSAKPVPWCEVVANQKLYLDLDCLPKGFLLRALLI